MLTHWGRVTHICLSKLTIIGSDNGLSPERRQAIIWINAGILLIGPLGTNFSEILIRIQTFSFKKMYLKMLSAKWRPFVSASMCYFPPSPLLFSVVRAVVENPMSVIIILYIYIYINSLWPSDATWWHTYESTLAQVITLCLTALRHYLNHVDLSSKCSMAFTWE